MSRRFTVDAHLDDFQSDYALRTQTLCHGKDLRNVKPGQISAESKGSDSLKLMNCIAKSGLPKVGPF